MDTNEDTEDTSPPQEIVEPTPVIPTTDFDISKITPHQCMVDVVQYGPFVHCNTANHDMYIGPLKQLTKVDDKFTIVDIVVD
jgi:hypothetical protein